MTETPEEVRKRIDKMYQRIQEESYYELLDVERDVGEKEVVKKFRMLAKDWHADRYSGIDLSDEDRQRIQEIFSAINAASQTLQDPDKRAEYDFELEAGNQDIEAVINAENAFRRGKNMMQTGNSTGAHQLFKRAHELAPDEDEYRAYYLYTEYLQIPKNEQGRALKKSRTQEIYDELDELSENYNESDWILEFLGVVAMGLGKLRKAKLFFHEALTLNPRNVTAKRQLRLIKMREEKENSKGFFQNLMDKITGN
ncbi:MAG: DnaJ domain-containing protein [Myxococcota bacterium]